MKSIKLKTSVEIQNRIDEVSTSSSPRQSENKNKSEYPDN